MKETIPIKTSDDIRGRVCEGNLLWNVITGRGVSLETSLRNYPDRAQT
jgi:hypothetical protein